MGSLALRNSTKRDETPSSRNNTESDSNRDGKPKSLKRRHGVLQESQILPPEKLYKQPRVSGISSPSSRPMNRSASSSCLVILPAGRPKDQALNASALSNKLQEVKKSRTSGQLGSGKDSDSKKATSISLSSLASAELVNRFKWSPIQRPGTLKHKSLPKPKQTTQVTIDLVSDDEEVAAPVQTRILPPLKKYVPVENNRPLASAQSNKFIHYSRNRKHGPQFKKG